MLRVLLIAPDVGLAADAEMELMSGGFFALTPLRGEITQERIVRATSRDKFDVIHIAAHGSAAGIAISGDVLSKEQLGQIAKQVNCALVFLNACDSAQTAQYLADRGVPLVLANTNETLDGDALRTAAYFYSNLAEYEGDYRKAYERVSPRDGSLALFAGAGYVDKVIQPIVEAIQRLTHGLDQLRQQMVGGQKNVMRVLAGAVVGILLVNGLALWGIAGAGAAKAQSAAELSRAIEQLPAVVRAGLIEQLVLSTPVGRETPRPVAVAVSPLPTVVETGEETREETRMMETRMAEEEEEEEETRMMETQMAETLTVEMAMVEMETRVAETQMAETETAVAMVMPTQTETLTQTPTETAPQGPPPTATVTETPVPTATATPLSTDGLSPEELYAPTEVETALPPALRWEIERAVVATLTAMAPGLCAAICQ